ncbi:MAG: MarR family transcriptional regulator [Blastochloris sp.]|nr:MarR family transcriptional regulator [Blastochloris sp.]
MVAWRAFITAHARIIERIDDALGMADQIPLDWYDVLIELYEAPERRLRMSELADRVVLSRSTLSHLVKRIECAGLLVRERSGPDRRGAYAVITEAGMAALQAAWPVYAHGISTYFAQHLSDVDARTVAEALTRMLAALHSRVNETRNP